MFLFFFLKIFNISTILNCKVTIPSFFSETPIFEFFYYVIYLYPKMFGFNLCYKINSSIINKQYKNNFYFFILILILMLPIRFFIKFLTGFSYLTIKLSAYITKELYILTFYGYDNISYYFDNFFWNFNIYFFYSLKEEIDSKNINIYSKNFIHFNGWIENIFDRYKLENVFSFSKDIFSFRMVETPFISKQPSVTYILDKNDPSKIGFIIQSSTKDYRILDKTYSFKKEEPIIAVNIGLFNKPNVFNQQPIFADLNTANLKLAPIRGNMTIQKISEQKKLFLKAFLSGLYKPDKTLINGKIIETNEYNTHLNRLIDYYNLNLLPDSLKAAMDYILEFNNFYQIENDPIKMQLWIYIVKNSIVTTDGNIILPNDENFLPFDIKNLLDVYKNNL